MQIVPVIKCSNLDRSIRFYTEVVGLEWIYPEDKDSEIANGVATLGHGSAALQLSRHAGDSAYGALSRFFVDDIDADVANLRARGLDTTLRPESPVHTGPVDQTWGLREFAFHDPDGNGLLFCSPIR